MEETRDDVILAVGQSEEQEGGYSGSTKTQESPLCYIDAPQPKFRDKGRVVLRGDNLKDDSGAYAAFTEQGSSVSQMTAVKVMDVIARQPDWWTTSWRHISIHSGKNGGRSQIAQHSQVTVPCGRNWWKMFILTNQLHFLITYIWDEFLLEPLKNYLSGKSLTQSRLRGPTMWKDMLKMRVKILRFGEQKDRAAVLSFKLQLGWSSLQERGAWISGRIVKSVHKLSWNACTWHELVGLAFFGQWTKLLNQSPNGQELGTNDERAWFHSSHKCLPTIVTRAARLSTRWISWLRLCWWPWGLKKWTSGGVLCMFGSRTYYLISWRWKEKIVSIPVLENRQSFRWMSDCEWLDYLLPISGMWW